MKVTCSLCEENKEGYIRLNLDEEVCFETDLICIDCYSEYHLGYDNHNVTRFLKLEEVLK